MEANESCFPANYINLSGECNEHPCSFFLSGAWGTTGSGSIRKRSSGRCGTDVLQTLFALQYGLVSYPSTVRSPYKEPYYLVSNDGKRFRLEFDCKNCQMKVKAAQ